jgi:hypothetical protein
MAKIYTYIFLAVGFSALFGLLGIGVSLGNFFEVINPNTIAQWYSSGFFLKIVATISAFIGIGVVVIGLFGRQIVTIAVTAGLASASLIALMGDWIRIVTIANNAGGVWQGWLVSILLAPFIVGYMFALWDWVRSGGDT